MADVMTPKQRSELMSRIQGRNTTPELRLRKALWAMGIRYRLYQRIGRYRPDLAFKKAGLVVFIDGCFWHQCPTHGVMPKSNIDFWTKKLQGNVARDRRTDEDLFECGWTVLRFWEHEVNDSLEACVDRVVEKLNQLKPRNKAD